MHQTLDEFPKTLFYIRGSFVSLLETRRCCVDDSVARLRACHVVLVISVFFVLLLETRRCCVDDSMARLRARHVVLMIPDFFICLLDSQ